MDPTDDSGPTAKLLGSGPGSGIADILPVPANTDMVTEPDRQQTSAALHEKATLSHALAVEDRSEDKDKMARQASNKEVLDLGWNEPKQKITTPLVNGMENEDLWVLIRRFNKQMYHVKATHTAVPGGLDLNIADEEEFSPDKLRANFERLYMTVLVSLLAAVKHVARLRSWRETRRTAAFALVYFVAWAIDLLVPTMAAGIIMLIVYPRSRSILFPPAPVALVSSKSGGVQKPKAGVLGSHDSATGAPENHKGEAVEQEASNFVNGIASVALSSATGKHPQGDPDDSDSTAQNATPDPTSIATSAADAKDIASGRKPSAKHDKTKVPMETAMWTKMRPVMHGLADFTDTWERLGNALSPTPPFPNNIYRLRLASLVLPVFLVSLFVTSYMVLKGATFGIGFAFFGDPVISRGVDWLNRTFPNWQQLLELRNTLLKGVPTNAQLTLTLLRMGEARKAPLPPPPQSSTPPAEKPAELTDDHLRATGSEPPLNATEAELDIAIRNDPSTKHETDGSDIDSSKASKHGKFGSKILGMFRGTTKWIVKTAIGTDTVRANMGSHTAKDRLGVVPRVEADKTSGPVEFKARYKGKKGHLYLSTKATIPALAFSGRETMEVIGGEPREDLHPVWSVAIADIEEMRKLGGYGWKSKLVVGWSLDREVEDSLEVKTRKGEVYKATALPLRDELFNRLVAMGGQKWESW